MQDTARPNVTRLNAALAPLAVGAAVFLLALGCLTFTREIGRVAAVWPVNAIVIATMLRAAPGTWARYLVAGLLGNIAADLAVGDSLTTALELSACNSLEIAICVGLSRRMLGRHIDLARPRDLVMFLLTAGALAPLAAATCAVLTLSHLRVAPVLPTLFGWYAPDALGLLIVTPALLALTPEAVGALDRSLRNRRGALSLLVAGASLVTVFGQERYPILFLIPPALIFVAFELNLAGAALALLATSVIAVGMTLTGHGPAMLIKGGLSDKLAVLQIFLATLTISVLPVAAALAKRRRLEEELRSSLADAEAARAATAEALRILALAQDVADVGEWRRNRAGDSVISDRALAILGISREMLTNRPEDVAILYHPDDRPTVSAAVEAALETGAPFKLKLRLNRTGEGASVVILKGEAERNAEGEIVAVVGVVRDVTDEERARQRVEESEARFRLLADASTDVVLKFGADGIIDYISPSIRRYGYEPEKLVGTLALNLIHEDDLEKARSTLADQFQLGTIDPNADRSYRMRTLDGAVVWMEGNPAILRDELGAPIAVITQLRDVTERKAGTEALKHSLEQVEAARAEAAEANRISTLAQQVAGIGHWRRRLGSDLGEWSDQIYALHGLSRDSFSPSSEASRELYHPDDRPRMKAAIEQALTTGEPFDLTARMYRADNGAERYVTFKGEAERGPDGEIAAVVGVMRDITEEETALRRIADSEARFRLLADSTTDIVLKVDCNDVIQYISPSARRYGYEPEELVGVSGFTMIHPDDLPKLRMIMADLFSGADPDPTVDRSYRLRTADGAYVWMEGNPAIIRDEAGAPVAVISQLRDVSERHAANEALAESEARYRLLATNSTDVIACYGPNAVFTFLSPALATVLGYAPEELVGKRTTTIMHKDDIQRVMRMFTAYVAAGPGTESIRFTYRALRKDGTIIWLEAQPNAIYHPDTGKLLEFQDVVRDVTARVGLQAELRATRDAARHAAAVKSDFMANMSHEIRTPLTAILGFTSLLAQRTDLAEAAQTQVQRVSGASQALLSIVNDILDFSKLEAGQVEIAPRPVMPSEVLRDTVLLFSPQAEAKGLSLAFSIEDELPPTLLIDPDRMRQILLNLIGNAVKFTDEGEVRVVTAYDRATQRLEVRVEDSGAGMSEAQQQKLFQRFSQVDASSTRRHGGTGLGLAICKGLVEAMGGEIGVRSRPGHGSVFHFQIDAPIAEAPASTAASAALAGDLADIRVLVVDDNPTNRELARAILESFGAEVTEAEDGATAVELAGLLPVDVILLDIRMPGLSGPETLARIRAEDGPNQDVPILAFTADIDLDHSGLEQGFDGLVRKPITAADLAGAIHRATCWEPPDPILESTDVAAL